MILSHSSVGHRRGRKGGDGPVTGGAVDVGSEDVAGRAGEILEVLLIAKWDRAEKGMGGEGEMPEVRSDQHAVVAF